MTKELVQLLSLFNRGHIHVVGRSFYRTARVKDPILTCGRDEVGFLENQLKNKDNHVVLIFQVLWGENGWVDGVYYALLGDLACIIGKTIEWKEF